MVAQPLGGFSDHFEWMCQSKQEMFVSWCQLSVHDVRRAVDFYHFLVNYPWMVIEFTMSPPPALVNNRSRFATFNLKWRHSQFESQNKNWSPANSEHTFWLFSDLFWFMCVWGKMDWAQLAFWQVTMTRASCLNQFQIFMQKERQNPSKDWSARLPNAKSPDLSKEFIKWFKTLWHTHKLNFTFCLKSSMNIQNAKKWTPHAQAD